jgi:hypothetical protein
MFFESYFVNFLRINKQKMKNEKNIVVLVTVFAFSFTNAQDSGMPKATFSKGDMWFEGGITLTTGDSSDLIINVILFNNIFAQPKFGLLYKW